jgi:hypothetical protein
MERLQYQGNLLVSIYFEIAVAQQQQWPNNGMA